MVAVLSILRFGLVWACMGLVRVVPPTAASYVQLRAWVLRTLFSCIRPGISVLIIFVCLFLLLRLSLTWDFLRSFGSFLFNRPHVCSYFWKSWLFNVQKEKKVREENEEEKKGGGNVSFLKATSARRGRTCSDRVNATTWSWPFCLCFFRRK